MHHIEGWHIQEVVEKAIVDIYQHGIEYSPRGLKTKELLGATVSVKKPTKRLYIIPGRNDNIFAKIAETLWTLQGRDDIEWLSWYLPRAKDFSDNGLSWRGAYGPRLLNWGGVNRNVNQLENVINRLKEDGDSRQGIVSLFDPAEDYIPTKDVPCNNWVHFIIRGGALCMNVAQRSSDVWWGFSGIDCFFWGVLHQMMAKWAGVAVGSLNYYITSFHMYERHFSKAEAIVNRYADCGIGEDMYTNFSYVAKTPEFTLNWDDLQPTLKTIMGYEKWTRDATSPLNDHSIMKDSYFADPLLGVFMDMLILYNCIYKNADLTNEGKLDSFCDFTVYLQPNDFTVAAIEYFSRMLKGDKNAIEKWLVKLGFNSAFTDMLWNLLVKP